MLIDEFLQNMNENKSRQKSHIDEATQICFAGCDLWQYFEEKDANHETSSEAYQFNVETFNVFRKSLAKHVKEDYGDGDDKRSQIHAQILLSPTCIIINLVVLRNR